MTKILIVEDNADMRQILRLMISDLGEVFECSKGIEAFSAYDKHRPDWVLMDIKLGGVNGIAATSEIKAVWPEARIVMVTIYSDVELREAALKAGACGYVLKDELHVMRDIMIAEMGDTFGKAQDKEEIIAHEINLVRCPAGTDQEILDSIPCPGCDSMKSLQWKNTDGQVNRKVIRAQCAECGDNVNLIVPGGVMGQVGLH